MKTCARRWSAYGLSIVIADLLLAKFGSLTLQFQPPEFLQNSIELPLIGGYPLLRLSLLGVALLIGIVLWLGLNRTRFGAAIRAGVDDREMLSALGINTSRLFVLVFAVGAGLAGLSGVLGGTVLSVSPGRGCALPALVAGRHHRRRHGQHRRCGSRCGAGRAGRAVGHGLPADLRLHADLHTHDRRARLAAGRPIREESLMSTPLETRLIRYDLALLCWCILYPFLVPDFWVLNIGAPSLFFGLIALSLSFLAGYGGMVSLAQMTVAGVAGYALALTSVNAEAMGVPLPWPLAVAVAVLVAVLFSICRRAFSRRAPRASTC